MLLEIGKYATFILGLIILFLQDEVDAINCYSSTYGSRTSCSGYQCCGDFYNRKCCSNTDETGIIVGACVGGATFLLIIMIMICLRIRYVQKNRVVTMKTNTGGTGITVVNTSNQMQMGGGYNHPVMQQPAYGGQPAYGAQPVGYGGNTAYPPGVSYY